jgi:putative tricarboxylic transport membrane protein
METLIANLSTGFGAVLALEPLNLLGMSFNLPMNLAYCFIGAVIGTLIGVLPGLGPVATIAMLLPATYALPSLGGLIMLAGIYYGAQYGGSTTAILVNLPGETSSVVTCIDGYPAILVFCCIASTPSTTAPSTCS